MKEDGNQRSSGGGIKKGSKRLTPFHQPFTKDHHIGLQSIKSEAITMLKVVILAICFEGDITFIISKLRLKHR